MSETHVRFDVIVVGGGISGAMATVGVARSIDMGQLKAELVRQGGFISDMQ